MCCSEPIAIPVVRSSVRPLACSGTGGIIEETVMLAAIALVLVVLWLLGVFAFHVTGAVIHVLLILAVIAIIVHFVRGRAV